MLFKDIPIQLKLMRVMLITSGAVLLLTCVTFFAYEYHSFRQVSVRQLSTLGKIIASNSTAALAFNNYDDANEILNALKAEQHIIAAILYDNEGNILAKYPEVISRNLLPAMKTMDEYYFRDSYLEGFQSVVQGKRRLGTLYLKSDLKAMYERFILYGFISVIVIAVSFLLAYILSKILQKNISKPILSLAKTAKYISEQRDYSIRAVKLGNDELGSLTDSFNDMLVQIQQQNKTLSEFNQNLEQKVMDRTNELQVANKELESFSYSISHDLRAPLRSIHGYTNIFSEDYASKLDDEARRLMNIILNNTKKMGQLIDDLLAFSQLGRKELTKVNVSMQDMVTGIWEELSRGEENRKIEFILNELPRAFADPNTIKQVWVNLISNALKYTRNKEIAIIEILAEEKNGIVTYCIKDNGAGFDMLYQEKLFGVFQRLHSQKEFEGTGVGLAIVHRIVAKHGGKIWAEAVVNEGATFYFSLNKVK